MQRSLSYCILAWTLFLVVAPLPHVTMKTTNQKQELADDVPRNPDAGNDGTTIFGFGCDNYVPGPPADLLKHLKDQIVEEPNPMFLLSEMAESLHRKKICDTIIPPIQVTQQIENIVVSEVKEFLLTYLNVGETPQDPCPSVYDITYNSKHYPRYTIEVVCAENAEEVQQCNCSGEMRGCFKLLSNKVYYYLTRDATDTLCGSTSVDGWKMCSANTGVGCSCAPHE